jgi:hypothetical protein
MFSKAQNILLLCVAASGFATSSLAQMQLDFEGDSLSEFLQEPANSWTVKDTALLGGSKALQHVRSISSANAVDKISILPRPNPSAQSDTWCFTVRYTSSTSTNNYWLAFLASDANASTMSASKSSVNAYAVGVYNNQGGDTLKLFKVSSGIITSLISTGVTTRNKKLAVRATRAAGGEWTLFASDLSSADGLIPYGKAADTHEIPGENFGFLFAFSSSNYRNFFVDDVSIDLVYRPTRIASVQRRSSRSLQVELSKAVDALRAADASRYRLRATADEVLTIDSVVLLSDNAVELFVSKLLASGDYTLDIQDLPDAQGMGSADSHNFSIRVPRYGDVVFSELMVRPNSESELPNEYIELYNRTSYSIDLAGWTIAGAARTGRITSGAVEANSYALIGGSELAQLGNLLTATGRPQLADGGASLALSDGCGVTVATLTYSDAWYADDAKKTGGYSLEKIDLDNFEENAANWRASNGERGGTPGELNSVAAANADVAPPSLAGIKVAGSELRLHYSEVIDEKTLSAASFSLDNGIGAARSLQWDAEKPTDVTLSFEHPPEQHVAYTLSVRSGAVCDLAQQCMADFTAQAGFGEMPTPGDVIINELMFHPRVGGVDFVELYNRSDKIAELEGLRLARRSVLNGALDKSYALPAYTLFPGEYVVATTLPDAVREQYRCPNPEAFITLATLPSYPNSAGCVALLDSANRTMEDFYYSEKMHSGILTNFAGVSLERISPRLPAGDASSWLSAAQAAGFATPTGKNSQYSEREDNSSHPVSLFPEVFSPDSDGFDDVLFISYAMPAGGYVANIAIFDAAGKLVKNLCRNATLSVEGRLSWDGVCNDGKVAAVGVYVVYVEIFSLDGKVKRYKETCVVSTRM